MAERLTTCPECKSADVQVLKIINPETWDLNADADLLCDSCHHEWRGKVNSPNRERDRENGWSR
jgi:transposase-like protein